MAVQDISRSLASHHEKYFKKVSDSIWEENAALEQILQMGDVESGVGGDQASWRTIARKDTTSIKGWGGWDEPKFQAFNRYELAKLPWRGYVATYAIPITAIWENKGDSQIFGLQRMEVKRIRGDALQRFEDDILQGDGTQNINDDANKGIHGLLSFLSTTLTYATIAQTGNTFWQAQVLLSTGSGQMLTDMFTEYLNCCRGSDKRTGIPTLIIMPRNYFAFYSARLTNSVRYEDQQKANAGFKDLQFMQTPVKWSDSMTGNAADQIYFLNAHHLGLKICNEGDMLVSETETRLAPYTFVGAIYSHCNLFCDAPRYQGRINATATPYTS